MTHELDINWGERAERVRLTASETDALLQFNAYQAAIDSLDADATVRQAEATALTAEEIVASYTAKYGDPSSWPEHITREVCEKVATESVATPTLSDYVQDTSHSNEELQ